MERHTILDVVDSRIVAIAIANDLIFWSGDRKILQDTNIKQVNGILNKKYPGLRFRYKKE